MLRKKKSKSWISKGRGVVERWRETETEEEICLMAYQPSWVIHCQSHPSRRTVVVLFNP